MRVIIVIVLVIIALTACQPHKELQAANSLNTNNENAQLRITPNSLEDINKAELAKLLNEKGYTFLENPIQLMFFTNVVGKTELTVSVDGNDEKKLQERVFEVMSILYKQYNVDFYEVVIIDKKAKIAYKYVEPQEELKRFINGEISIDRLSPDVELPYTQ